MQRIVVVVDDLGVEVKLVRWPRIWVRCAD